MAILDNLENAWDDDFDFSPLLDLYKEHSSLSNKIFSETVCENCEYESKPMLDTDNMGRDISNYN